MGYKLARFVIDPETDFNDAHELDADFILQPDERKIVHGVVRNETGSVVSGAVVKFYKVEKTIDEPNPDPYTTRNLTAMGYAITDDGGEFFLGPLAPDIKVVLKIFFLPEEASYATVAPSDQVESYNLVVPTTTPSTYTLDTSDSPK